MEQVSGSVGPLGGSHGLTVGTGEAELTQAIRRLNRAVLAIKIEAGMREGRPTTGTPLTRELDKQLTQLESIRTAYGLKDEE